MTFGAPTVRQGPFLEDLKPGRHLPQPAWSNSHRADNIWFTCLTMNTNQSTSASSVPSDTRFEAPLGNSRLTLSLVMGLSVSDTSENGKANLSWTDVKLPHPVSVGDTLWAEGEILSARRSRSRPDLGMVETRTRGVNQRGEAVIEYLRTFMASRREADAVRNEFPGPVSGWAVGLRREGR